MLKSHCKSFNDTAFWSEEESYNGLCTVSVKGDKNSISLCWRLVFKEGLMDMANSMNTMLIAEC